VHKTGIKPPTHPPLRFPVFNFLSFQNISIIFLYIFLLHHFCSSLSAILYFGSGTYGANIYYCDKKNLKPSNFGLLQRVVNPAPLDAASGRKPPNHWKEKHWKTHRKSVVNNSKS
jgi:hypothetical protein